MLAKEWYSRFMLSSSFHFTHKWIVCGALASLHDWIHFMAWNVTNAIGCLTTCTLRGHYIVIRATVSCSWVLIIIFPSVVFVSFYCGKTLKVIFTKSCKASFTRRSNWRFDFDSWTFLGLSRMSQFSTFSSEWPLPRAKNEDASLLWVSFTPTHWILLTHHFHSPQSWNVLGAL